ncbi:MAG: hypothetical protein Alpg2KO_20210 [Alphaproteobacteria bacterium]
MKFIKRGAGLTGYGLVVGLIAITALTAVTSVGSNTDALFTDVSDTLVSVTEDTIPAAPSQAPADSEPDPFGFTDQGAATGGNTVVSNTVTLTGFNQPLTLTLSGDASGEVSINGGSFGSGGTVENGDTIQLRVVASLTPSATVSVTATIASQSDQWDVTTDSASVFLAGTFNGTNIYAPTSGCPSGDYYCQAELACETATGADCQWQSYNCSSYPNENGSFYPTSDPNGMGIPTNGSSSLNWTVTSSELQTGNTPGNYTSSSYGNLCACYSYPTWQYQTLSGCGVGIWSPY